MTRKVTRAKAPRTVPTIAQIAAALILSTASITAEAATDAGIPTAFLDLVVPAGVDAAAGSPDPNAAIRLFVDDEEYTFGKSVEVPAGKRTLRFVYRSGETYTETVLLKEGETRTITATSCPYHPGQVMGGSPPPPHDVGDWASNGSGGGGCCGSTPAAKTAGYDLRALAAIALAAAFTTRRRKKR